MDATSLKIWHVYSNQCYLYAKSAGQTTHRFCWRHDGLHEACISACKKKEIVVISHRTGLEHFFYIGFLSSIKSAINTIYKLADPSAQQLWLGSPLFLFHGTLSARTFGARRLPYCCLHRHWFSIDSQSWLPSALFIWSFKERLDGHRLHLWLFFARHEDEWGGYLSPMQNCRLIFQGCVETVAPAHIAEKLQTYVVCKVGKLFLVIVCYLGDRQT